MGKGEGNDRYLSVAEVRTLFVERRFPARIVARLAQPAPAPGGLFKFAKAAVGVLAAAILLLATRDHPISGSSPVVPGEPAGPGGAVSAVAAPSAAGYAGDQVSALARSELVDRGPALVSPCEPGHQDLSCSLRLVCGAGAAANSPVYPKPGLLSETGYLERFGFLPSPKTIHTDKATLRQLRLFGCVRRHDRPAPTPSLV